MDDLLQGGFLEALLGPGLDHLLHPLVAVLSIDLHRTLGGGRDGEGEGGKEKTDDLSLHTHNTTQHTRARTHAHTHTHACTRTHTHTHTHTKELQYILLITGFYPFVLWQWFHVSPYEPLQVGPELDAGREEGQSNGEQLPASLQTLPGRREEEGRGGKKGEGRGGGTGRSRGEEKGSNFITLTVANIITHTCTCTPPTKAEQLHLKTVMKKKS